MGDSRTESLYYDNPLLDDTEATIVRIGGEGREIELDRTLFYPEGGGQPCDLGEIGGVALESVSESAGSIVHRLSAPLDAVSGGKVRLRLDRPRRIDHTEQHSAQHLLSGFLYRDHGIATLSFHLGTDRSTIDVDAPEFPDSLRDDVESRVNAAVAEGWSFVLHVCPPENLRSLPLRRLPPENQATIRVWEIAGLDFSPCCGTHVASAAELRLIKIHASERYKGKIRIHFSAGGRAVEAYRRLDRAAGDAARLLSVSPEELPAGAERLSRKSRESAARADHLLEMLVGTLVEAGAAGVPLALDLSGTGAAGIEEGMRNLKARGRAGVVSVSETATVVVVGEGGIDLPASLVERMKSLGGRGGGPAGSLRATFKNAPDAGRFAAEALEMLGNVEK